VELWKYQKAKEQHEKALQEKARLEEELAKRSKAEIARVRKIIILRKC
jgi:hypothetical protein